VKKILVVDDHPDIRRLLCISLDKDFHVLEACDGKSAMKAVLAHRPDAVLLDIMMPGELDGLQVLDAIRAHPELKGTLVAMATARGQASDRQAGLDRGADAYFIKPFSPLQLLSWLREQLA
jgi:DNA-binding response OmpR family regulator